MRVTPSGHLPTTPPNPLPDSVLADPLPAAAAAPPSGSPTPAFAPHLAGGHDDPMSGPGAQEQKSPALSPLQYLHAGALVASIAHELDARVKLALEERRKRYANNFFFALLRDLRPI